MSEEKDIQQTLFQEDSHANLSPLQEKEKEQKMIATSGMKCLELLPKSNQNLLLAKMCKELLTSTTAWYSDRCKLIWKHKVSKSNVFLFQLQASVLGTGETESGFWHTPTTMDHLPIRTEEALKKQYMKHRKGRTSHSTLRDQVAHLPPKIMWPTPKASGQENAETLIKRKGWKKASQHNLTAFVQMYPTPTASCQMDVVAPPETVKQNSKGWSVTRVGTGTKFGAKLNDVVNKIEKMYNTPTTNDSKNLTFPKSQTNRTSIVGNMIQQQKIKPGGKLNPNFVEFLMGFPMNWTRVEPTESKVLETQSFPKSPLKSEKQS